MYMRIYTKKIIFTNVK